MDDEGGLPPSVKSCLESGELFDEKYHLLGVLGQGSFATVVHGRHEAMERDVALKFLREELLRSHPEVGERFTREGRLASRLSNRHTVGIFDLGETPEGIPFMVLEHVEGRPLDEAIKRYGALGLRRSIRLTLQILESLDEAHQERIIHRDLKPANIMVGKRRVGETTKLEAKVLDFGVAKLVESPGQRSESGKVRKSTQFIGTPRYMSPEQILGKSVEPSSDLYSLGLIFFEMCTGRESLPNDNVAKVAQLHLDEGPLKLEGIEELPSPLVEIIRRATARHQEDRFRSARQFRQALKKVVKEGRERHRRAKEKGGVQEESASSAPEEKRRRRTSEVFSGKGYVELPELGEEDASSTPVTRGRKTPPARRTTPKQVRSTPVVQDDDDGGELELDTTTLDEQRRQIATRRRETHRRQRERDRRQIVDANWGRRLGGLAGVLASGYVGFCIVAGALEMMATSARVIFGLAPVALALLWAQFSTNAYPDWERRVLFPWAKRSLSMVAIAMVVLAVAMPRAASQSLMSDATWWLGGFADTWALGWLVGLTESICSVAATLLHGVADLIPWSD